MSDPTPVRDRRVLAIGALIVVAVLAVELLGLLIPPFGEAMRQAPIVVVVLVVVTTGVLAASVIGTLRRR